MANYDDQNRILFEETLDQITKQLFVRLKLGLADWDIDDKLRVALQEPTRLNLIQDIVKSYDETYDMSVKSNTKLKDKYKTLYKLNK